MSTKTENTGASTLAHELVAREEQNIGTFFSAFAIQFYMCKEMLKYKLVKPNFIHNFSDVNLYASQRVLIKNFITNPLYRDLAIEIEDLLVQHNNNLSKPPHEIFLSNINKAFLIRQIFKQTDQVLPKYKFIEDFIGLDISQLDINKLGQHLQTLPVGDQILVVSRIFSQMKDSFESKKKTVLTSFIENIKRTRQEYIQKNKAVGQDYNTLEMFYNSFYD